ncbi:MAG: IS630 family transposase [Candidatus Aminicenantes bacterium]
MSLSFRGTPCLCAGREGRPARYGKDFLQRVLQVIDTEPPKGATVWDGKSIAERLESSPDAVWRVLRENNINLARKRTWCVSTDSEFVQKAADIVGLYLNPPENALVISIDEKPSIQAKSCPQGYVVERNSTIVRAMKSTYRRNGTLNLFAALDIATGKVIGETTERKRRVDFLKFMDQVYDEHPCVAAGEKELHVILDNYCIHKRCDTWLEEHPHVSFHYTPTSASWLNMVEIWFNIFSRKVLKQGSFNSTAELADKIGEYITASNGKAHPFIWKKREVRGTQIHDTIANLRN